MLTPEQKQNNHAKKYKTHTKHRPTTIMQTHKQTRATTPAQTAFANTIGTTKTNQQHPMNKHYGVCALSVVRFINRPDAKRDNGPCETEKGATSPQTV